jgi:uroporphyrinogen III methyltransferase/synthase
MARSDAEPQALAGRHIIITRPREQAPELAVQLEALGARVTALPAIAVEPLEDPTAVDAALARLATYDWIVLTSVNGVRALAERLEHSGRAWSARGRARIAVIGPATARALGEYGVVPDVMPDTYVAESIVEALGNVAGQHILLLRADIARQALAVELRLRGADVDEVAAYRTVVRPVAGESLSAALGAGDVDAITFTSSSTVHGLLQGVVALGRSPEEALRGIALAAIGPVTAATLREYGLEPAIVAREYTIPGLVRALVLHFTSGVSAREGV